jgi:predicted amidohydrolase
MKLGLLICYDVEFPEYVRRLAIAGAQAVLAPTALPASDHVEVIARKMIPVRAFENQVFVAYVNHCGADPKGSYAGLSGIAAPDGTMLAAAEASGEALLVADLDVGAYRKSAEQNPYIGDLIAGRV